MDELSYIQHSVAEQIAGDFLDEIEKLQKENKRLRGALKEIYELSKYDGISKYLDNCYIVAQQALNKR